MISTVEMLTFSDLGKSKGFFICFIQIIDRFNRATVQWRDGFA